MIVYNTRRNGNLLNEAQPSLINFCFVLWYVYVNVGFCTEVLINKSNGTSKQSSADDASDDEDGDDVDQDIEGSADHPGDY